MVEELSCERLSVQSESETPAFVSHYVGKEGSNFEEPILLKLFREVESAMISKNANSPFMVELVILVQGNESSDARDGSQGSQGDSCLDMIWKMNIDSFLANWINNAK